MIRVLIISGSKKTTECIREFLACEDDLSITISTHAAHARRLFMTAAYDFIIINYPLPDEADYRLVLDMNVKNNASILLLVHHEKLKSIEDRMQKAGIMTVGKPIHQHTLFQLLKFAILTQRKQKQHQKDEQLWKQRLQETKVIQQAKCLLLEHEHMNEQQAHKNLEKKAMNARLTRLQLAKAVIRKYENKTE